MVRNLLLSILLMYSIGCASQANLEFNLDTWKGHSVNGLVAHWGAPSKINNLSSGNAQYTWLFDGGIANVPIEGTVRKEVVYCKIIIDVDTHDTIESYALEGNDCKV